MNEMISQEKKMIKEDPDPGPGMRNLKRPKFYAKTTFFLGYFILPNGNIKCIKRIVSDFFIILIFLI